MREVYDSRDLAHLPAIAADTAELHRLLEQALAVAHVGHTHALIVHDYPSLQDYSYDFSDVMARVTRWFVGRKFLFEQTDAFLKGNPCGYFRIVADAGMGKTALAAALAQRHDALVHFFNTSEGITSPKHCLNHLCAQLIARFGLPHTHLPKRAGSDAAFLGQLLREVAGTRADGRPLVLVIDALDEADSTPAGHNWAHLPASLPAGIYVFLTHCPGDYLVQTEARTALEERRIEWFEAGQQDDIERHLWRQADRPEIQAALAGARPLITVEAFVAGLKERSQGNFKYLDYVLADIEAREPGFDPLQIDKLPKGLPDYYGHFWDRIKATRKAEGWAEWRDLYRPLIELLAAAGEPVTADWLAVHTGREPDEILERALLRWQRFLHREERDGRETWRIVHRSFADFLATKIDLAAAHRRIAAGYLADPGRWMRHDRYAFRYLSSHLAAAGMFAELGSLIERRDWYEAQRDHDSSLSVYAADVERALAVAEACGLDGLAAAIAWSLLHATIRTRATQVPIEALETMVLLGEDERALRNADLIMDPTRQNSAFLHLAQLLHDQGRSTRERQALERALVAAERIRDDGQRLLALNGVVFAFSCAKDFPRALAVLQQIEDHDSKASALRNVALCLAQTGDFEQALATAECIAAQHLRADVLCELAQTLAHTGDFEQALTAAQHIEDKHEHVDALYKLAQTLARAGDFEWALVAAQCIEAGYGRVDALCHVARSLSQAGKVAQAREILGQAVATAQHIEDEHRRVDALCHVARP